MSIILGIKRRLVNAYRTAKLYVVQGRLSKSDPRILKDALEILPSAWLFAGTLLGAVRDRRLIRWDGDIDIGCSCDDITTDVIERFKAAGFTVKKHYRLLDPRMQAYVPDFYGKTGKLVLEKNGSKVEVCCFADGVPNRYLGCEVMYFGGNSPRFFVLPKKYIYPLVKFKFLGTKVNVPQDYEGQLSFIYGESWRQPKRNWYFTAEHYLCRERTIVELGEDDGTQWSKWVGRSKIREVYGVENFPEDINEPFIMLGTDKNMDAHNMSARGDR